jgi:uncharacterized protein (TIGR02246 family)
MESRDPEGLVRAQLDAYNSHDLDRFLTFYADDAVIFDGRGEVIDAGRDAIQIGFGDLFARMPDVRAEYAAVISVGQWVAVHDIVPNWRRSDGSIGRMEWLALYRVVDGKITELRLHG